ncbi:TPA: hypothetical protein EYP75_02980 [Candidatus Bathyarchaeota archaeon]|nr:hypothetical protein [Candidatus Bathyarchaeota archaeon]
MIIISGIGGVRVEVWEGSWSGDVSKGKGIEALGFQEYERPFKTYWNDELSVGILERDGKYTGVTCLVAKEVTDKDNFVKKFGLRFGGDIHWRAAPVLLDHLSRSPLFKAILVTINNVPFKLEPDIPSTLKRALSQLHEEDGPVGFGQSTRIWKMEEI